MRLIIYLTVFIAIFALSYGSSDVVALSSAPQVLSVQSLIVPGESSPARKTAVPTDNNDHYLSLAGGFDKLTKRGVADMLILGRHLLESYPVQGVHVQAAAEEPTSENSAKHLLSIVTAHDSPVRNTSSSTVDVVSKGVDLLLNSQKVCRQVELNIQNQYWASKTWRQAHFRHRYLLERLTDVGLYKEELHLVDLIPYAATAQLRRRYRDDFLKEFQQEYHWERMQEYFFDMIQHASGWARRFKFYGPEHDRMPARFVGGYWLLNTLQQLELAQSQSVEVSAGRMGGADETAEEMPRRLARWQVAPEDSLLAVLTALDVMNSTIVQGDRTFLVNVSLPEPGWHLDVALTAAAPASPDPLVHLVYQNQPLLTAAPCRSSSLRESSPLPQPLRDSANQFGQLQSSAKVDLSSSNACCTLSEFHRFVDDVISVALHHTPRLPVDGEVAGPVEEDFFGANDVIPGFGGLPAGGEDIKATEFPPDSPVSQELWDLLFPDGVKESSLPVRKAGIPSRTPLPAYPKHLESIVLSPLCPFALLPADEQQQQKQQASAAASQ